MTDNNKIEVDKDIVKKAIKEWMDDQFREFGKFALKSLLVLAAGGLFYLWLSFNGWHK